MSLYVHNTVCLVRVKEGADIRKDIKDNVDPMKWLCGVIIKYF